ncbi:neprilysin-4-like [Contarinia nasturtii]|uniref:neprilysin-4-like n=1 Tax=Contarinia nasturtii TaxID=265458 RepID=UPI0012D49476|nr:neprilysin-4-like [Contarinia nasturtii]
MSGKGENEMCGIDVEAVTPNDLPPLKSQTSVTNSINCRIGVDKKSGRVKWCPDCQFIKFLLVLPIILLPIIVVFVLMMRISSTFTGRIEVLPTTERVKMSTDLEAYHRLQTRDVNQLQAIINHNCEIFRDANGVEKSIDMYDKDLFRDIRTSFIPSEMCLRRYREMSDDEIERINSVINDDGSGGNLSKTHHMNQSNGVDQLRRWINKYDDSIDFNRLSYEHGPGDFQHRRRRRQIDDIIANQSKRNNDSDAHSTHANDDYNKETVGDKPLEIPAFLRTFWKGGKTYDQIRNSQVEIIKQYMDSTVPPCSDFYQYACGNWDKLNPIPKDKAAYDTFEMLREILDIELNGLLAESEIKTLDTDSISTTSNSRIDDDVSTSEMPLTESADSIEINIIKGSKNAEKSIVSAEKKAKNLYKSCMNSEILEQRQLTPLYALLETLGGWPVLDGDKWDASKFNWLELAAKLRLYNNDVFIMQWVGPDIKNSNENVIQFDQNSLGLPTRDYFIKSSNHVYLEAYQAFAQQVIQLCGANVNDSIKAAEEIVKFEIELASIMASPQERINVTQLYRRMTVAMLYDYVPEIDWQNYLQIVLEQKIDRNEVIVMFALNFMQDVVHLINNVDARIVANYMLWKFVRHRINSLDDRFQEAKQQFYNVLIGRKQSPPRWKICVNQVNSNMGMAVGAMFVREYFDDNSKQDTLAMTHELQDTFREIINETYWLDDETKALAESKVDKMSLKIGYPDYILNEEQLNEKYADLDIHPERYFENILNVLRHLTRSEQTKLREAVNRTTWNTNPAVVNAYYSRNKNQIIFPAAMLQPPFYHRFLPRSFNFGGIGVVIGHELTHGFDDKGRLFDQYGNLNRWWSEPAIEVFHQRASCLISQYGNYKMNDIGGVAVDGIITQGENIADNGGIKQAYRAYEKWLKNHCQTTECINQEHLEGLNVTHKQLFFLNFAQVWCGAMRPEATKNKMKTAVHSPARYRVIGTLSNSKEFSDAFGCSTASAMNPPKKCSVW